MAFQVRSKKFLGQHFLKDKAIAKKITDLLSANETNLILEVGPGTGALTKHLINRKKNITLVEIDSELIAYLKSHFPDNAFQLIEADFLTLDIGKLFNCQPLTVIGNFPYNISSQIIFKVLENVKQIPEAVGMFQKEVALRICAKEGSKTYGILSVLTQFLYDAEIVFDIDKSVFAPPPKVESAVIRLKRRKKIDVALFPILKQIVKQAFNQRRKTIRNSLKSTVVSEIPSLHKFLILRAEQIPVSDFVFIAQTVQKWKSKSQKSL